MKEQKYLALPITAVLLIAILTSCLPAGYSPEAAAAQTLTRSNSGNFIVDTQTIQVIQRAALAEGFAVQIRFQGTRAETGIESCLGIFEMKQNTFGAWMNKSSAWGCASRRPPVEEMPVTYGMARFGGDRLNNKPAYSIANGETFLDSIAKVTVTWNDGAVQEIPIVNSAFLAVRQGEFEVNTIKCLDDNNKVVFSTDTGAAPGKQ